MTFLRNFVTYYNCYKHSIPIKSLKKSTKLNRTKPSPRWTLALTTLTLILILIQVEDSSGQHRELGFCATFHEPPCPQTILRYDTNILAIHCIKGKQTSSIFIVKCILYSKKILFILEDTLSGLVISIVVLMRLWVQYLCKLTIVFMEPLKQIGLFFRNRKWRYFWPSSTQ